MGRECGWLGLGRCLRGPPTTWGGRGTEGSIFHGQSPMSSSEEERISEWLPGGGAFEFGGAGEGARSGLGAAGLSAAPSFFAHWLRACQVPGLPSAGPDAGSGDTV